VLYSDGSHHFRECLFETVAITGSVRVNINRFHIEGLFEVGPNVFMRASSERIRIGSVMSLGDRFYFVFFGTFAAIALLIDSYVFAFGGSKYS
jgi:hypothetical protein